MRLNQQNGSARTIDPGSSADPVDVVVGIFGRVYLQDEVDVFEVDAPGDDVSGKQDSVVVTEELLDDFLSFACFEFAVNAVDVLAFPPPEVAGQELGVVINAGTGAEKHDDFGRTHLLLQEIYQKVNFLHSVLHHNISVVQALRDHVPLGFVRSSLRSSPTVDSFQSYFGQVPHSEEVEMLLLHAL